MLDKKCLSVRFISRSCLEETNYKLNANFYFFLAYSAVHIKNVVFQAINKYFNSFDKSLIVNCWGRYFLNFLVFHLALKISYAIRCCNFYFDMYLLEINQRSELMDSEKTCYIAIIRLRHRRTEWKAKNDLRQWFLTDGEIIFHSCFGCIHQALQNSTYRKYSPILEVLKNKCVAVEFWSRSCLDLSNYNFDRNLHINSGSFCCFCQEYPCFHVVNNYFNLIDSSFIVK